MSLNKNQYYHTFYTVDSNNPTHLIETVYDNTGTLVSTLDRSFGINVTTVLGLLDTNSTTPYTLGLVDTSNTAVCTDLAYFNVYSKALNTSQKTKLIQYITQTYKEPRTNATQIYTVTVSGGVYWISGVAQPFLTFTSGNLYVFDQSHVSNTGNTLVLGTGADTGIVGNNVVYNGTAGSLNAYTLIDFSGANAATTILYYFSSTRTNMGYTGTITTYVVTVTGGVYSIAGLGSKPNLSLAVGSVYVFNQSDGSNTGNQLVLGTTADLSSSIVTTNVTYNVTPGTAGAYTLIKVDTASLVYFSRTTTGMGYKPTITISSITGTYSTGSSTNYSWVQVNSTGSSSAEFNIPGGKTLYYFIVGGGGSGAPNASNGAGGGGVIDGISSGPKFATFSISIGLGAQAGVFPNSNGYSGNSSTINDGTNTYTAKYGGGGRGSSFGIEGGITINYISSFTSGSASTNNGQLYNLSPIVGLKLTLDSNVFYFAGGGGGADDSTSPGPNSSIYGGGYGNKVNAKTNGGDGAPNTGGGGGACAWTSWDPSTIKSGKGGSGCAFFFWLK